jgi:hypothetical protein
MEVGWLNGLGDTVPGKEFLNECERIYKSTLFRWITKAIRERDTGFFHNLTRALANADMPWPSTANARQLVGATSALRSREPDESELLRARLKNSEWLAHAADEEISKVQIALAQLDGLAVTNFERQGILEVRRPDGGSETRQVTVQRSLYSTDTRNQNSEPTKDEVLSEWEKRQHRSRKEINTAREFAKAKLSHLPEAKPGRRRTRPASS